MRIGLLEVSHWHLPLYTQALRQRGDTVVAVCDSSAPVRERVAREFRARAYADAHELLASEPLDFAFVFGRHCDMSALGHALVERGTPFCIEKPAGMTASEVHALGTAARARQLFVAVPLVQRVSPMLAAIERLQHGEGARFLHSSWRFLGGPPQRYLDGGNDWMLDPACSGGGCLINLAPHFIDLVHHLHGSARGPVACQLSNAVHGLQVEDHAMVSMACARGATGLVETGYCFPAHPAKREFSFTLVSATHHVRSCDDGMAIYRAGSKEVEVLTLDLDADPLYGTFVQRVLDDLHHGRAPVATLADLEPVMEVVDAARARCPITPTDH